MEGDDCYSLSEFFDNHHHHHNHDNDENASADFDHLLLQTADHHDHVGRANSPDDIFSALEALEGVSEFNPITSTTIVLEQPTAKDVNGDCDGDDNKTSTTRRLVSQKSTSSSILNQQQDQLVEYSDNQNEDEDDNDNDDVDDELLIHQICSGSRKRKNRQDDDSSSNQEAPSPAAAVSDGTQRTSHITVERNRRKQMNQHLSVLRSLMPCFYVKRGDQASIIGGVVDYINELQQVLQSLEAKKQRKVYSEVVLSPRIIIPSSSTTTSPLISPRKPPLSPRLILNNSPLISPTTPQPLMININHNNLLLSPTTSSSSSSSSSSSNNNNNNSNNDAANELVANSKSHIAEVEVKFSGANVLLKTVSPRIPGQPVKIISALENLSLEVLHVNISTVDQKMLNSFTVKIGIECQLSAEELAQLIQQTFTES